VVFLFFFSLCSCGDVKASEGEEGEAEETRIEREKKDDFPSESVKREGASFRVAGRDRSVSFRNCQEI
jgi:hypothetical protein